MTETQAGRRETRPQYLHPTQNICTVLFCMSVHLSVYQIVNNQLRNYIKIQLSFHLAFVCFYGSSSDKQQDQIWLLIKYCKDSISSQCLLATILVWFGNGLPERPRSSIGEFGFHTRTQNRPHAHAHRVLRGPKGSGASMVIRVDGPFDQSAPGVVLVNLGFTPELRIDLTLTPIKF